jgi:hypothetical protein
MMASRQSAYNSLNTMIIKYELLLYYQTVRNALSKTLYNMTIFWGEHFLGRGKKKGTNFAC